MFKIETCSEHHGWIDYPELLGIGCSDDDNRWPTEAEALAACDELAAAGFHRCLMRVVTVHA